MRHRRNYNNVAEAGISAMIIFVALVLVSAVVSITIVSFGQQIFKSTQDDAEKTENVIYGKIIVSSVIITAIELIIIMILIMQFCKLHWNYLLGLQL